MSNQIHEDMVETVVLELVWGFPSLVHRKTFVVEIQPDGQMLVYQNFGAQFASVRVSIFGFKK